MLPVTSPKCTEFFQQEVDELIFNTSAPSTPSFADDVMLAHRWPFTQRRTVVRRLLKVTYQGQHQTGATSDVYDCGRGVCMCAADFPPSKFQFSSDRKTLTISSVCMNSCEGGRDDLMVIQCNASNQHGYVLANGYVNVFGKFYINSVWQGCARDLFGRDPKRDVVSPRRD